MRPSPEISVVILCYKAGNFAPLFVDQVKKVLEENRLDYEMILVANFNKKEEFSDPTPAIVRNLAASNPRLTVVAKAKEGMMGWDMRTGLEAAQGETIAVIDGDGQMPPKNIYAVYQALKSENADMALTYRTTRQDGWVRLLVSRMYNLSLKLLFPKVKIKDANSKPKIFTRKALQQLELTSTDWFIDAEIAIQASDRNFKIAEVPMVFLHNPTRASFINTAAIVTFALNLLKYRLKKWVDLREKS